VYGCTYGLGWFRWIGLGQTVVGLDCVKDNGPIAISEFIAGSGVDPLLILAAKTVR